MILIIDNYDSFTYNLVELVKSCTTKPILVLRNDEVDSTTVLGLQPEAIIISPGACSPSEAGYSVELVKDFGAQIPILGICLGHQSIGAAYGAIIQRAKVVMHGQIDEMQLIDSSIFRHLPPTIEATRYHSLAIDPITLPETLVPIAYSTTDQSIMAIKHRTNNVFGLQFHPESYGTLQGKVIMTNFIELIDDHPQRRPL